MAFQPFGYRFEVKSALTPSELKAAIRRRKKRWLDPKSGARGWIVGPFLCLWLSVFNEQGPMLVGRISSDNLGARVRGRAGSDLNGIATLFLLVPIFALALLMMSTDPVYSTRQMALSGGIFAAAVLLSLWWAHASRREAEPLIRFLNDVSQQSSLTSSAKLKATRASKLFKLNVSGDDHVGPITAQVIHDALLDAAADDFVILSSGEETYIQTQCRGGDGFILEKREGSSNRHFQASRKSGLLAPIGDPLIFTFEEICDVFMAFATEAPMPAYLSWAPMRLSS